MPASRREEPEWTPLAFRAPRGNGAALIEPSPQSALADAASTQMRLDAATVRLQGRTLSALREWTRKSCLTAAAEFTSDISGQDIAPPENNRPIFLGGHQPALFHPGVWVKNFLIAAYASRTGGTAVNLVVDNDTLFGASVSVPAGDVAAPRLQSVPWDAPHAAQPWEDVGLQNAELFRSLGARLAEEMRHWGIDPLVSAIWPDAVQAVEDGRSPAVALVAARHRQERRWGLANLELPVSLLCAQPPFLWFASHLLAQLPRFHDTYNTVLEEYRLANRVRSRSHPVPELSERDGWLEAPFWVWRDGDHRRRQVFARQMPKELLLSDGSDEITRLRLTPEMDACCAVEGLQELAAQGVRFRTRALTTTLFTRLCLGDHFVHGIGGAKYDEMTDRIISRFFGIAPPPFQMATATLQLPIQGIPSVTQDDVRSLRRRLRDLQFNAERHGAADESLIARKQELVALQQAAPKSGLTKRQRQARRAENRLRYRRLREVEQALAAESAGERERLSLELAKTEQQLAAQSLLQSREYAYCLYPAETLRELMNRITSHLDTTL